MQIFAQVLLPFDRIVGKCRVAVDPHYPVNGVLAVESLVDMDEFFPLWVVSCLGGVVQHTIDVPEVTPSAFILQRHLDVLRVESFAANAHGDQCEFALTTGGGILATTIGAAPVNWCWR